MLCAATAGGRCQRTAARSGDRAAARGSTCRGGRPKFRLISAATNCALTVQHLASAAGAVRARIDLVARQRVVQQVLDAVGAPRREALPELRRGRQRGRAELRGACGALHRGCVAAAAGRRRERTVAAAAGRRRARTVAARSASAALLHALLLFVRAAAAPRLVRRMRARSRRERARNLREGVVQSGNVNVSTNFVTLALSSYVWRQLPSLPECGAI